MSMAQCGKRHRDLAFVSGGKIAGGLFQAFDSAVV
jgi:hypothetical protein